MSQIQVAVLEPGIPPIQWNDEGIAISDLATGARLEIETERHTYSAGYSGGSRAWICGHPDYCPEPIEVLIIGSCICPGQRFEFWHPVHDLVSTTRIRAIRRIA